MSCEDEFDTCSNHHIFEPPHDKTNKMTVHPAKTQISLGIRPVWSEPSLCANWVAKDPSFVHADSEDSDQTGPRLILVFAGRTCHFVGLPWGGSFHYVKTDQDSETVCIISFKKNNENVSVFWFYAGMLWFFPHFQGISWLMKNTKGQCYSEPDVGMRFTIKIYIVWFQTNSEAYCDCKWNWNSF